MTETFYTYMLQFVVENSARGDLAGDMQYEQERSPWNTKDLNEIDSWEHLERYLRFHHACSECLRTAKRCWRAYEKTRDAA